MASLPLSAAEPSPQHTPSLEAQPYFLTRPENYSHNSISELSLTRQLSTLLTWTDTLITPVLSSHTEVLPSIPL